MLANLDGSAPPRTTATWLANVSPTLRERLDRAGVCEPVKRARTLALGELVDEFTAARFNKYADRSQRIHRSAFKSITVA